jgi:RNA polymerase sigma-70 factor (ECF subfamily)
MALKPKVETPRADAQRWRNAAMVERLYRTEYRRLVRRLVRMLRCADDAEEVAQLAFVKLLEADVEVGTLRSEQAFLYRVARNLAIDHIRHNGVGQLIFADVNVDEAELSGALCHLASDAERGYAARDMLSHVDRALQDLPVKCRTTFILSKLDGNTYPEIARKMGLSISMIEKYMGRAVKHVKMLTEPEKIAA